MNTRRDPYFDNAKLILIFFVVLGHFISPLKYTYPYLFSIYKFIFLFHMPAFILISGYFSKPLSTLEDFKKMIKRTLFPYAVFQSIYCIYYYAMGYEKHFSLNVLQPHWTLWFLLSLFFWKLFMIPFSKIKRWGVPLSLIIAIFLGYFSHIGSFLSLERTFVFFPFFLLGYQLKQSGLKRINFIHSKPIALFILSAVFIVCIFFFPDQDKNWLLGDASYSALGVGGWYAALLRIVFYLGMLITTISVLSLIPDKKYHWTKLGVNTLYIYLFHGFVLKTLMLAINYKSTMTIQWHVLLPIIALMICYLFGQRAIKKVFQPLVEGRIPRNLYNN